MTKNNLGLAHLPLRKILRLYRLPVLLCTFGALLSIAAFSITAQEHINARQKEFNDMAKSLSAYVEQRLDRVLSNLTIFRRAVEKSIENNKDLGPSNNDVSQALMNNAYVVAFALMKSTPDAVPQYLWVSEDRQEKFGSSFIENQLNTVFSMVDRVNNLPVEKINIGPGLDWVVFSCLLKDGRVLLMIVDSQKILSRSYIEDKVLDLIKVDVFMDRSNTSNPILAITNEETDTKSTDQNIQQMIIKKMPFKYKHAFFLYGHDWTILVEPNINYFDYFNSSMPWVLLILGLSLTGFVSIAVFQILSKNLEINEQVGHRTIELNDSILKLQQEIQSRERAEIERDLAKREEIESARLTQAVLNTVVDGIITINARGSIESFNPSAERIFGYKADEVIGKNINVLMPDPYNKNHDDYIRNYLRTGQAKIIGIGREVSAKRKDGSIFPMDLGVSDFTVGDTKMFVGSIRDISNQKQAEEKLSDYARLMETINFELAQAKKDADQANRLKSDFIANMSHEIRTPLNSIIGVASVMEQTELNPKQVNFVRRIINAGKILSAIINNILDLSKIEAGALSLEYAPFNPRELVEKIVDIHNVDASNKGLILGCQGSQNLPDAVIGDAARLSQILNNLIGNAIKFTQAGSVTISCARVDIDDKTVELRYTVCDTGVGIPTEQQKNIFGKFVQADVSITRKFGGSGLGLAICKQLTEMMGGTIWFESTENKGTCFYLNILFARPSA